MARSERSVMKRLGVGFALGLVVGLVLFFAIRPTLPGARLGSPKRLGHGTAATGEPVDVGGDSSPRFAASPGSTAGTIEGEVVAEEDGSPVAGALVYFARANSLQAASEAHGTRTDERGWFSIPAADGGGAHLIVLAFGHVPEHIPPSGLQVEAGSVRRLRVQLSRGSTVAGIVRNTWGVPVADAEVRCFGRNGRDAAQFFPHLLPARSTVADYQRAVTDAAGTFRVSGLTAFPVFFEVRKSDHVYFHGGTPAMAAAADSTVEITLSPVGRLGLQVIDDGTRETIDRFLVTYLPNPALEETGGSRSSWGGKERTTAWNRRHGEYWYTFRPADSGVAPGGEQFVDVPVFALGYEPRTMRARVRWPGEPDYDTPQVCELTRTARSMGELIIVVRSPSLPRPLPSAMILIGPDEGISWGGTSGPVFEVALDGNGQGSARVPAGRYHVGLVGLRGWYAWKGPGTAEHVEVPENGAVTVELQLDAAVVTVDAIDAEGRRLYDFRIDLNRPPKDPEAARGQIAFAYATVMTGTLLEDDVFASYREYMPPEPGRVSLLMNAGEHHLLIQKDGYTPEFRVLTLSSGGTQALSVQMKPTGQ